MTRECRARQRAAAANGYSLVELMVALSIGLLLSGSLFQSLIGELQNGQRLMRQLRERRVQERTLDLIASEVARADRISPTPQLEQHACSMAGRLPVLHLSTNAGAITYSVGSAPSGIWRGQVLMRCGPAFGLDGSWNPGSTAQNRVVIDGLAPRPEVWRGCADIPGAVLPQGDPVDLAGSSRHGFSGCLEPGSGLMAVRIQQDFETAGRRQSVRQERLLQLNLPSRTSADEPGQWS